MKLLVMNMMRILMICIHDTLMSRARTQKSILMNLTCPTSVFSIKVDVQRFSVDFASG